MPVTVSCPSCGTKLKAPDSAAGRKLACPKCKAAVPVPADPPPPAVADARSLAVAASPPAPPPAATKPCPFCAEPIAAAARKCKHCGERLDEPVPLAAPAARKPRRHDDEDDDEDEDEDEYEDGPGRLRRARAGQTTVIVHTPKEFPHLLHLALTFFSCGAWLPVYIIHGLVASRGGGMTLALALGIPAGLCVLACGGCLTLAGINAAASAGRSGAGDGPADARPAPAAAGAEPAKPAGGGGNVRANRNLKRDEFRNLVLGKSPEELVAAIGKPNSTQDTELGVFWYYENVAGDPVTGKRSMLVQITIENGRVTGVNFN